MRGDKVAFLLDDGEDRLRRLGSIVDATAGVFAGRGPVLSVEELREEAERAIAEDTAEHSRLEPVNDYETPVWSQLLLHLLLSGRLWGRVDPGGGWQFGWSRGATDEALGGGGVGALEHAGT